MHAYRQTSTRTRSHTRMHTCTHKDAYACNTPIRALLTTYHTNDNYSGKKTKSRAGKRKRHFKNKLVKIFPAKVDTSLIHQNLA